jgi:glycosyltransferase involved in cell wall biosynthesis
MPLTTLHVRGPFRGPTGYEHHVREFVRELSHQGVRLQLTDLRSWGPTELPAPLRDRWFETLGRPTGARTVLHFCMPHQVQVDSQHLNVNHTMFEATRIPDAWVAHQRQHDLVIVPTESSRRAWLDSGVPEAKLRVCPLGINPHLFGRAVDPWPLTLDGGTPVSAYPVRFLNISTLIPRKNILGLLRVWLRATSSTDGAVLLLKLGAYPQDAWAQFEWELERLQADFGKRLDQAAPIHLVEGFLSDAQMPRLYAAATHYISLSHGEGWDQAMVEAAASGLALIAPDHSAYTAYLDPSSARLLPSRLVPTDLGGWFEGASWWAPDEDVAVEKVRAAIAGDDGGVSSPRDRILAELSWERATKCLRGLLEELEVSRPRRFWPRLRLSTHA